MLSLEQGSQLVELARRTIKEGFVGGVVETNEFNEKRGVFVTLLKYPSHELRGCIGFPYPSLPLGRAVTEGAKAAAFCDPRFFPLQKNEINRIAIEISVLTVPEEIKSKRGILNGIKTGRDGLIIQYNGCSGLLLPQVATEQKWDAKEFLEHTCMKAGLDKGMWKEKDCKILKFRAQIFAEEKPNGRVIEKKIKC